MADSNVLISESRSVAVASAVFSIFIPSWNNLSFLKLCIDSLRKHSGSPHQIIVHINEGSDGTYEWVKAQQDLSYTFSSENIGICYALNQCRTIAFADYFLYLNDDMYVCPRWDDHLINEIRNTGHDSFFFSGTAIEPVPAANAAIIVENFGSDIADFKEDVLLSRFHISQKSDWQGATWPPNVVHKKIWDLVGGYSIEYSPGLYSDQDFSMKLWKVGIRLFKGVSASRVYHFGRKSTKRMIRNQGYYTFISKWGMTAGTFTTRYLRNGQVFDGPLPSPNLASAVKMKNWYKRTLAYFKA